MARRDDFIRVGSANQFVILGFPAWAMVVVYFVFISVGRDGMEYSETVKQYGSEK